MDNENIRRILEEVRNGSKNIDEALDILKNLPFSDLGFAKIDHHRVIRRGYPEVIYCSGKTIEQVTKIFENMMQFHNNILGTRANREMYEAVKKLYPEAEYNDLARTITIRKKDIVPTKTYIAVITAGTSDIPVAEEAAVTAEIFGNKVERLYDVGIAGIHRLYSNIEIIKGAKVLIVIAGMEGALPSVVGGLVDKPVIAVPTSIGYGAAFNGVAALLGMLTSCSSGTAVVNIDNGFGAGYMASMINKL